MRALDGLFAILSFSLRDASFYLFICLSTYLTICLYACLSIHLSTYPSIYLYAAMPRL